MALRIKSYWHDEDTDRSLDEIASAAAYIAWRISKEMAINLHGKDFVYESDEQRMGVIIEYLLFQLQIIDRLAHDKLKLELEDRKELVIALAKKMSIHVQDNSEDLFGEGDYVVPFIQKINQRGAEYSEFSFTDNQPSYPFYRHLGSLIQKIMGDSQENRWVIDQVMDVDGPDINRQIIRSLANLFD